MSNVKCLLYVLFKDFITFMTSKTNHNCKKHCQYCLKCFSTSRILEKHTKIYPQNNHTKALTLTQASFINYADLESI